MRIFENLNFVDFVVGIYPSLCLNLPLKGFTSSHFLPAEKGSLVLISLLLLCSNFSSGSDPLRPADLDYFLLFILVFGLNARLIHPSLKSHLPFPRESHAQCSGLLECIFRCLRASLNNFLIINLIVSARFLSCLALPSGQHSVHMLEADTVHRKSVYVARPQF